MDWTDDPLADFHRYDRAQEQALSLLPKCSRCRLRIQSQYCYEVDDEYVCDDCITEEDKEDAVRIYTNDVIM